jgi:hypothetical protein
MCSLLVAVVVEVRETLAVAEQVGISQSQTLI